MHIYKKAWISPFPNPLYLHASHLSKNHLSLSSCSSQKHRRCHWFLPFPHPVKSNSAVKTVSSTFKIYPESIHLSPSPLSHPHKKHPYLSLRIYSLRIYLFLRIYSLIYTLVPYNSLHTQQPNLRVSIFFTLLLETFGLHSQQIKTRSGYCGWRGLPPPLQFHLPPSSAMLVTQMYLKHTTLGPDPSSVNSGLLLNFQVSFQVAPPQSSLLYTLRPSHSLLHNLISFIATWSKIIVFICSSEYCLFLLDSNLWKSRDLVQLVYFCILGTRHIEGLSINNCHMHGWISQLINEQKNEIGIKSSSYDSSEKEFLTDSKCAVLTV